VCELCLIFQMLPLHILVSYKLLIIFDTHNQHKELKALMTTSIFSLLNCSNALSNRSFNFLWYKKTLIKVDKIMGFQNDIIIFLKILNKTDH
jgi:hypothetical protein